MFTAQQVHEVRVSSPAVHNKMGIGAITNGDDLRPRKLSAGLLSTALSRSMIHHPQTPPDSTSGSPTIKLEASFSSPSRECSPIPRLTRLHSTSSPVRLPSIHEFDQGVEALARSYGLARPWTPPSPLRSVTRSGILPQPLPSIKGYASHEPFSYQYHRYHMGGEQFPYDSSALDGYPSPPPEGENRHINQKYTTEEGDFIIYAWHDKKLKWQRIKQDFATMFGRTPERTVQGLQAWYYRMNQRIPLWDDDGWLIFENGDDLEPRHISIKCRERDNQDKPMEPLGLAQRYPERAIHYHWVDADTKRKARDWAAKRALQYRERRERRKRKEHRRMKL